MSTLLVCVSHLRSLGSLVPKHDLFATVASGAERRRMDQLLPAGFRFFPTDEELITCYLARKAMDASFTSPAIRDVDLYKSEPWDLPCT